MKKEVLDKVRMHRLPLRPITAEGFKQGNKSASHGPCDEFGRCPNYDGPCGGLFPPEN